MVLGRQDRLILEVEGGNISTPSDILSIVEHIKNSKRREVLVVVTGSGNLPKQITSVASQSSHNQIGFSEGDEILALEYLLEAQLITAALKSQKINATYIDPFQYSPIRTMGNSGSPQISETETVREVKNTVGSKLTNNIIVMCGLVGKNEQGKITIIRDDAEKIFTILKKALNTPLHKKLSYSNAS
ncbi:MAG: hypothetical protein QXS27_08130 [Candidatus Jordarchaeaceae archaeon]